MADASGKSHFSPFPVRHHFRSLCQPPCAVWQIKSLWEPDRRAWKKEPTREGATTRLFFVFGNGHTCAGGSFLPKKPDRSPLAPPDTTSIPPTTKNLSTRAGEKENKKTSPHRREKKKYKPRGTPEEWYGLARAFEPQLFCSRRVFCVQKRKGERERNERSGGGRISPKRQVKGNA